MYSLQKISDFDNCEQIQALFSDLPKKPYCTNAKGFCYPRTKEHAITHVYIQPNHPAVTKWLVFDVDDSQALFAYHDKNAPRPQIIIKNPTNGHAHFCYRLSEKVGLWGKSSQRAVKYLEAVYNALQRKLGADRGYSGNLIKNPTHSDWQTYTTGADAQGYTLAELAEYLDLDEPKAPKVANDSHFGRNCAVFHTTRHQAYAIAHKHDHQTLYSEILTIATTENAKFNNPMHPNELHHIAKSITRYCKSPRFTTMSAEWFSRLQAHRGKQGGKAKGKAYEPMREQAKQLREQGLKQREIAEKLGVSERTLRNWQKSGK